MMPRGTALRSRSSVPVAGSAHIATMTNATQVTRTSLIAGVPGSRCCRRRPRRHIATAGTVTVRLGDGHGRTVTSFGVHISASVSSWVLRLPGLPGGRAISQCLFATGPAGASLARRGAGPDRADPDSEAATPVWPPAVPSRTRGACQAASNPGKADFGQNFQIHASVTRNPSH